MVTPFTEDGAVDYDRFCDLARHLVENGSDGVVVTGTTGESPTLSDEERLALLAAAVEAVGDRAAVVAGTGTYSTAHSVHLTERAHELGVDGFLVVTPYYNKPPVRGIVEHFRSVAAASDRPVIVYNIPARTAVNMPPDLLAELAQIDGIVGVKQANSAELQPIDGMAVLAGNDDIYAACLDMGGAGGICVASHIVGPEMRRMYDEPEARAEIDASLQDVYDVLFCTANPIPLKAALNMLGHDVGGLRLPLVEASDDEREQIRACLERLRLLERAAV